jgi:hypothetical protein
MTINKTLEWEGNKHVQKRDEAVLQINSRSQTLRLLGMCQILTVFMPSVSVLF